MNRKMIYVSYNKRLSDRGVDKFKYKTAKKHLTLDNPKFDPVNMVARPFHGLTTIAWVKPGTELFNNLVNVQKELQDVFKAEGFDNVFVFLKPESFHMTVCDIDVNSDYGNSYDPVDESIVRKRREQVGSVFSAMRPIGPIESEVKGLGLTGVITGLVRFSEEELIKVLKIEKEIKKAANVDKRSFTGHISLAYFVNDPGLEGIARIKEIIKSYENTHFGEFIIDNVDLTYFTDMNTYLPLLSSR